MHIDIVDPNKTLMNLMSVIHGLSIQSMGCHNRWYYISVLQMSKQGDSLFNLYFYNNFTLIMYCDS